MEYSSLLKTKRKIALVEASEPESKVLKVNSLHQTISHSSPHKLNNLGQREASEQESRHLHQLRLA